LTTKFVVVVIILSLKSLATSIWKYHAAREGEKYQPVFWQCFTSYLLILASAAPLSHSAEDRTLLSGKIQ